MKKVIVVRVEDVLVKKYDVKGVYGLKMKKYVRGKVGDEVFDEEVKRLNVKGNCVEELMKVVEGLEKRYEEEGKMDKKWEMKRLREDLDEMNVRGGDRMKEMEREYVEEELEKRKIGCVKELRELEKVGEVVKGFEIVYVSEYRRKSVERLLMNNGLEKFRVVGSFEELGDVDREKVVMFGNRKDFEKMEEIWVKCVVGVKNMFEEIGLVERVDEDV